MPTTNDTVVKVYTTPDCGQCMLTKKALERRGLEYIPIDLTEDPKAAEYVKSLGYTQAPVVVAGEKHWSGFRPDKISGLLQARSPSIETQAVRLEPERQPPPEVAQTPTLSY